MYAPFIIATNGQLQSGYQDGWTRHLFTHGLGITLPGLEQVATPLFRAQTRVAEVAAKKRTDTDTAVPTVWKYPQDVSPVAVNWSGRYPSGATSLDVVLVTVTDALEADVTSTRLLKSQVDGDRSLAYIQGGAAGDRYTVSVAQTFNTGAVLYEYVEVEVRNPTTQTLEGFFKYPLDIFPLTLDWLGRQPQLNQQPVPLGTLGVTVFDSGEAEVTSQFLLTTQVLETIDVAHVYGGTAGQTYRTALAQTFTDGSIYHDYKTMTVRAPAA